MFYYLEGVITIIEPNLARGGNASGAGYACHTTSHTLSRLELGKKARLYTYCNIKEDAFDIFGFYDVSERRFFEQLLTVSGVGPKAALSILSAGTPETLAVAIVSDDERRLTAAPGIGKKLAQRVILELKDKIAKEARRIQIGRLLTGSAGRARERRRVQAGAMRRRRWPSWATARRRIGAALRGMETESLTVERDHPERPEKQPEITGRG